MRTTIAASLVLSLTAFSYAQPVEHLLPVPRYSMPKDYLNRATITLPQRPDLSIEFGLRFGDEPRRVWLVNADEEIEVPVVTDDGETLTLRFDEYDSEIVCPITHPRSRLFKGEWVKRRGPAGAANEFLRLPFETDPGPVCGTPWVEMIYDERSQRTLRRLKSQPRWRVKFADDDDPAVLVFRPRTEPAAVPADRFFEPVAATFLTTTGDYRYLTPKVAYEKITMSVFDGSHAFLFEATLQPDGTLKGDFWSGPTYHTTWTATPDPDAKLPDGFSLTTPVPGFDLSTLRYPGLDGVDRPLIAPPAKHGGAVQGVKPKVRIIELFGTWCPNCKDAAAYLKELHAKYAPRGLEITALAFEVTGDRERDLRQLGVYRDRLGVPYAMLLAGTNDKKKALASFPAVEKIKAYPTFLFVDAAGKVRATYTGFSGPATGDEHTAMKGRFEKLIETMLAE
jgi:thiol-disulfide isomerase/thioredoxin